MCLDKKELLVNGRKHWPSAWILATEHGSIWYLTTDSNCSIDFLIIAQTLSWMVEMNQNRWICGENVNYLKNTELYATKSILMEDFTLQNITTNWSNALAATDCAKNLWSSLTFFQCSLETHRAQIATNLHTFKKKSRQKKPNPLSLFSKNTEYISLRMAWFFFLPAISSKKGIIFLFTLSTFFNHPYHLSTEVWQLCRFLLQKVKTSRRLFWMHRVA